MKYFTKEDNFNDLVKEGIHLVDFYAEWCGPCKMLGPVLESMESEVDIIKVNIDEAEELTNEFKIMSVPTMIIFKDGKKLDEIVGFHSKEEILEMIENLTK